MHDRGQQVDHDDESHGETAETAQLLKEDELAKIMDCGIDPTTSLRQQDFPIVGGDSICVSVSDELGPEKREVLEKQSGEEPILSQMQQILRVKCVDPVFRVLSNDLVRDE